MTSPGVAQLCPPLHRKQSTNRLYLNELLLLAPRQQVMISQSIFLPNRSLSKLFVLVLKQENWAFKSHSLANPYWELAKWDKWSALCKCPWRSVLELYRFHWPRFNLPRTFIQDNYFSFINYCKTGNFHEEFSRKFYRFYENRKIRENFLHANQPRWMAEG